MSNKITEKYFEYNNSADNTERALEEIATKAWALNKLLNICKIGLKNIKNFLL